MGGSDGAQPRPSDAALSARLCLMGGDGALCGTSLSQGAQPAGLLSGGAGSWTFPIGASGGGVCLLRVPEASELEGARALRLYVELNAEAPLAAGEAACLPQSARFRTAQVTEATVAWCRVPLKYLLEAQAGDRVAAKLVSGPTPLASPGGVGAAAAAAAVALQGGDRKRVGVFLWKRTASSGASTSPQGQLEIEVLDAAQAVRWDPDLLPSEALVNEAVGSARPCSGSSWLRRYCWTKARIRRPPAACCCGHGPVSARTTTAWPSSSQTGLRPSPGTGASWTASGRSLRRPAGRTGPYSTPPTFPQRACPTM